VEQALKGAHRAASHDLLEALSSIGAIDRAIVATDDPNWEPSLDERALAGLPVTLDVDPPGERFHFGRRLVDLIERYDVERVLYTGGGSAPLLQVEQWAELVDRLGRAERLLITNNVHSCDWAGFTHAQEATSMIADQTNDNAIAWVLVNEGAFPVRAMEASAGSRFDIDTPVDLLIADRHPAIGWHLRRYLDDLGWESPQLDAVMAEMRQEGGSLMVAGRASPAAWEALQRVTRCWVRVFAEERGMRASGRQRRGEVRSLLTRYLDLVGFEGFFKTLGELANGVLLDNRVILASRGLWPSALDRFNSDLCRWDEVEEPFLRDLTRAAAEAAVPVVMGGHTVVAGGLMALAEAHSLTPAPTA
jgi:CTP:molybdopterin cytidylyltransferase MocA